MSAFFQQEEKKEQSSNIDYRKYCQNLKGIHLTWSNKPNEIFPLDRNVSGSHISQKRINVGKIIVKMILKQESKTIEKAFMQLANKKYKGRNMILKLDFDLAFRRVESAKVKKDNDYDYGEADDQGMWISAAKQSDSQLISTMLHESLHYMATFNNKDICEKDEHYVIKLLGDTDSC